MESNCKLELKMFYKTQTAHKLPSACTPITPSPPTATEWTRFLPVFCSVRRRPYNEDDSAVFCFLFLVTLTLTLTFKLVPTRNQTRLHCKFDANPFSRSADI